MLKIFLTMCFLLLYNVENVSNGTQLTKMKVENLIGRRIRTNHDLLELIQVTCLEVKTSRDGIILQRTLQQCVYFLYTTLGKVIATRY